MPLSVPINRTELFLEQIYEGGLTDWTLLSCAPGPVVGSYLLTLLSSFTFSTGWWTFDCLLHICEMCRFKN